MMIFHSYVKLPEGKTLFESFWLETTKQFFGFAKEPIIPITGTYMTRFSQGKKPAFRHSWGDKNLEGHFEFVVFESF